MLRSQPTDMIGGIILSLSEMVIQKALRDPAKAKTVTQYGWKAVWAAIGR